MLFLEMVRIGLTRPEMVSSTGVQPVVNSQSHKSYEIPQRNNFIQFYPAHPSCPKRQPQQLSTLCTLWQIRMCGKRVYFHQCGCQQSGPIRHEYCGVYLDNLRRLMTQRWCYPRHRYQVPECSRTRISERVQDGRCESHLYTAWLEDELKMEQRKRERMGNIYRSRAN